MRKEAIINANELANRFSAVFVVIIVQRLRANILCQIGNCQWKEIQSSQRGLPCSFVPNTTLLPERNKVVVGGTPNIGTLGPINATEEMTALLGLKAFEPSSKNTSSVSLGAVYRTMLVLELMVKYKT